MHWLIAEYQPVALFSLKHGEATSTGGKSLLVPTPFAIRMALLDAAIRTLRLGPDHSAWEDAVEKIRSPKLAVNPPPKAAVTSLFAKVLKPERNRPEERAFQQTIAFREYVHLQGTMKLAFGDDEETLDFLESLLPQVNYFGKRGSFFQLLHKPQRQETAGDSPPAGFVPLEGFNYKTGEGMPPTFPLGIIQRVDDWGPKVTPGSLNIYASDRMRLGQERIRFDVVLPYQIKQAGRGFTVYESVRTPH